MLLISSPIFSKTYKAEALKIDGTYMVGKPIIMYYKVELPLASVGQDDITYKSTDDLEIQSVVISHVDSESEQTSDAIGIATYILQITMIAKVSGMHIIPPIHISNTVINIPYLFVYSNLDYSQLKLKPIFTYVPVRETMELVFFLLSCIIFVLLNVKLCMILVKKSRIILENVYNFINLGTCIMQINKIISLLKRVTNTSSRRHLITNENYKKLLKIIRKRVDFLYHNNKGDSSTPEEIMDIFIKNFNLNEKELQEVRDMFIAYDEVLYGKKKLSVKTRLEHSIITKNLLLKSHKYKRVESIPSHSLLDSNKTYVSEKGENHVF